VTNILSACGRIWRVKEPAQACFICERVLMDCEIIDNIDLCDDCKQEVDDFPSERKHPDDPAC